MNYPNWLNYSLASLFVIGGFYGIYHGKVGRYDSETMTGNDAYLFSALGICIGIYYLYLTWSHGKKKAQEKKNLDD